MIGDFDEVDFSKFLLMRNPLVSLLFLPPLLLFRCGLIDGDFYGLLEELALLQAVADIIFEGD